MSSVKVDCIEAKKLVLTDDQGRVRISMGFKGESQYPYIAMYDEQGEAEVSIERWSIKAGELSIIDPNKSERIQISAGFCLDCFLIYGDGETYDTKPSIFLLGPNGDELVVISEGLDNKGDLYVQGSINGESVEKIEEEVSIA
jgi:hypothetical protein